MKITKLITGLPLMVLTIAVIAVSFLAMNLLFMGGAAAQLMAPTGGGVVEGTVTTDAVEGSQEDLNMAEVADKITKMQPSSTPLATIFMQYAKKVKVKSQRTEFYAVDIKPFSDKTAAVYVLADVDYAAISVADVSIFNVDDTVMFPDIEGGDGQPFVGCISKKDNASSAIHIQAMNGVTGADTETPNCIPGIVTDSIAVRMGPAKSELDAQTAPFAVMPEKDFNYTQNFMAQVEESVFQRAHKQEVNWDFTDYEEMNIYDMKARMEMSYIWGIRAQFVDKEDEERKFTCGGLASFMTKTINYTFSTGITNDIWVDWTQEIFADNAGSDTRFLFAGDDLLATISKIEGVNKQLEAKETEVKWGITFSKVETKFGTLFIKRHPLFGLAGQSKNGIVLDVNHLEEHEYFPLQFTTLELKKSGQRNANATVLQKVSTGVLRYPGTHAMIIGE